MTKPLYGISREKYYNALRLFMNIYGQNLDPGLSPYEIALQKFNARNEFFSKETPENKEWLINNNFLETDKPEDDNKSRSSQQSNNTTKIPNPPKKAQTKVNTPKKAEKIQDPMIPIKKDDLISIIQSIQNITNEISMFTEFVKENMK